MAAAGDSGSSTDNNTEDTEFLECGLCYENDDLKRLPCSPGHIFCVTCLTKDSEQTKIILCPVCKRVFEDSVDALPSATAPIDEFNCCDVCRRKDEKFRYAQVYCVICAKKFCDSHLKSHNDALDDHRRIPMIEYQREYRKLEKRYCVKHPRYQYGMACEKCYEVMCIGCNTQSKTCIDGSNHSILPLDDLETSLIQMINDKKIWMFEKEESFLEMEKSLTNKLSEFDSSTEEMIRKLHAARAKHIEDILRQYADLECKLIELRSQSKARMTQYLDDEVGKKLNKLSRQLLKINSRVYSHHQVDIVKGFEHTNKLIDELITMKVEKCKVAVIDVRVEESEKPDTLTCQIVQSEHFLHLHQSLQHIPLPTSMKLLRSLSVGDRPISVCHHDGITYVGNGKEFTIERITSDGKIQKNFIKLDGYVSSVKILNQELYVAVCDASTRKFTVRVLNSNGKMKRSWSHDDSGNSLNKIGVCGGDKIVLPNRQNGTLTVYNQTGDTINSIKLPQAVDGQLAVTAGENFVIVSHHESNSVFKVDINTGETLWTSKVVKHPQGVAHLRDRYVMVTNDAQATKIWILDCENGDLVGEISGKDNSFKKFDMAVTDDDQLIISYYQSNNVEFYQLD